MAQNNIKFQKKVLSNKTANEIYNIDFENLTPPDDNADFSKIEKYYNDLFYSIKKTGQTSHQQIVTRTFEYINYNQNKALDNQINLLTTHTATKDTEYDILTNTLNQHPIWEDGSLIQIGGNNQAAMGHEDQIFIMQEGRRREIADSMLYTVKKFRGIPEDAGTYYISIHEFNQIDDGWPIDTEFDLTLTGDALATDLGDLLGVSAHVSCSVFCSGNEIQDIYDLVLGDNNSAQAQYYTDNEPCHIKYIKDTYINDNVNYQIVSLAIPKGQWVSFPVLRRTIAGSEANNAENLPNDLESIYNSFSIPEIEYNGNNINNYIKNLSIQKTIFIPNKLINILI